MLAAWPWLNERIAPLVGAVRGQAVQVTALPTATPVQPHAQTLQRDGTEITLYFRYQQTDYVSQETRYVEVARDETVAVRIVSALLAGPSASHLELTPVFAPGVTAQRVTVENDLLTVVLSESFLQPPADAPADWAQYAYWQQEVPRRRRLAAAALVNALTEGGRYARVQLLVASGPEDTQGERVPRVLFYPEEKDATLLLPPLTRQEGTILTPQSALNAALSAWQRKDWLALYAFMLQGEQGEGALPPQNEFLARVSEAERALLAYRVSPGTVAADGAQATLCVDVQVMGKRGDKTELSQAPILMRRERDAWKLSYEALMYMME